MVLEVMGRHAGWVSLFTGIAAGADYICVPERPVDVKDMVAKLKAAHARKKVALVVASEAIDLGDSGKEELDEFGHMILKKRGVAEKLTELIEKQSGIETRSAVIGHMQRGGAPTLFDRILGTRVGVKAAELVDQGKFGQMAALRGTEVLGVSLEEATGKLKTVTKDWLAFADTMTSTSVKAKAKAAAKV
jgi:6-phosphofructokinase 1